MKSDIQQEKSQENFVGYVEGYLTTTDVDREGDKLTPQAVEKVKRTLDDNSQKRIFYADHDTERSVGRVLDWKLHRKSGGWVGLWGRVGITDIIIWRRIKSGELSGFSLSFKVKSFRWEEVSRRV